MRSLILFCVAIAVSLVSQPAMALSYHYEVVESRWISTDGGSPAWNGWFNLDMPSWYDSDSVSLFEITLGGHGDNGSGAIDIYLSFNDDLTSYVEVGGYNVQDTVPFTLTLDIFDNDLLYNGDYRGELSNVTLDSFSGLDDFWLGFGCHFTHDYSSVDIEQMSEDGIEEMPTPEPTTMLLLGSGLAGLVGLRKRFQR